MFVGVDVEPVVGVVGFFPDVEGVVFYADVEGFVVEGCFEVGLDIG